MKSLSFFSQSVRASLTVLLLVSQTLPAQQVIPPTPAMTLLIQKARSLEARDRADLAAQVWQQVLVTNPNQPDALAGLARWAKRSGKNDEANAYLSRLRRIAPDTPALTQIDPPDMAKQSNIRLNEAAKLAANGQSDEAMRIYREVFGAAPPQGGWATAYYETLANTSAGFEPAVAALEKLAATYPDVPGYKLAAGKLLTYRPATRQAGIHLLSSISPSTAAGTKAREAWRQALLWEKNNPAFASSIELYVSRYADPELQAAMAGMRSQAAKVDHQTYGSKEEQLGYSALKDGNVSEAEKNFGAVLAKDAKNGRAHSGLGFALMKTGDFDRAVQELSLAQKALPNDSTVSNALESARFWQAMHEGAKATDAAEWNVAVESYQHAVSLKPNSDEAIRGLGGALLASGSPAKALPYLERAKRAKTLDESAWCAFVTAKLEVEGGKAALTAIHSAPDSFSVALERNVSWKALKALAYANSDEPSKGEELYRELLANTEASKLSTTQQVELASLALRFRQPEQALPYARKAVEDRANDVGAWEVLLSALVSSGRPQEAERVYNRMPRKVQESAMAHPGFLEALASFKEMGGDLEASRSLLEQAIAIPVGPAGKDKVAELTKLHMAQVLSKLGRGAEAESIVTAMVDAHPADPDAWRAHFQILQTLHRENEIVSVASQMPQNVAVKLGTEGDIVTLLARAHGSAGDPAFGVKLLETYISRTGSLNGATTVPQRIQLGWLLMNSQGQNSRLFTVLDNLNTRTDLNDTQRKEVTNLWVTWILRSSDSAHRAGNDTRAMGVLQQGMNMFPNDPVLLRALAGNLMAAGNTRRALNVYSNWGLTDAQADDFAGAIGAALAENNGQYADAWIDKGLSAYPNNSKLLELAGERAKAHGDLKRAELYWRQALAEKKTQPETLTASVEDAGPSLKTMLVGTDGPRKSARSTGNSDLRAAMLPTTDEEAPQVHFSSFGGPKAREDVVRSNAFLGESIVNSSAAHSSLLLKPALPADTLEDKIAALESRNTPYLGTKTTVWGRGGEAGFGKLLIEQTELEASLNLSASLRASLLLKPTFLSSGTANGTGSSLFGRQSTVGSFGPQTASGIAPEAQLSSDSFGLRFGTTPQGFRVTNWVGGLRVQPKGGPITLILERDSVKDTMLAFSGVKDPQSGQTWGGVMANTAGVQGRWGDDKSGFYANGAYQVLDGRNVARNTGFNGGFGTWWKVAVLPTGSLTVGMNFSAMHYDRNLRYFTFGQGGYFSPQQYFLFNVPVRWAGTYGRRLQYSIGGSLGLQHFAEDASEYYPNDAALQAKLGYFYQALSNTGANFSFDGRVNYQMAPHWILGAFVAASNARNYTAASAGLFVKYTFEERPMSFQSALPSTPDWRGQQPFLLF